jgi:ATP-dependent DNA helicase RecG
MPSLKQALEILHHPKEGENLAQIEAFKHIAQQRLIIEELCAQHQHHLATVLTSDDWTINLH